MKVSASEIHMASNSRYIGSKESGVYEFDESGNVISHTHEKKVEQREKDAYEVYITNGEAPLALEHKPMDEEEKRIYTASVFGWAADAIEAVVTQFEKENQDSKAPKNYSELQVSIYRETAVFLQEQATTLLPEGMTLEEVLPGGVNPEKFQGRVQRLEYASMGENETTLVGTRGVVRTAEGREINFSLEVGMHRESRRDRYELEMIKVVDPLVINFSGDPERLGRGKMEFDMDGDGQLEQISRLADGNGFLALDLNEDGKVNNGRELFGPSLGDGFRELSFYDKDNNRWIDENDPVFEKLMVWTGEEDGMKKLSETGIGAIHLGAVASDFTIVDSNHNPAGQVVASGVALTEAGEVRSIQQIDLIV